MSYYSRKGRERFANRIPKYERELENKKNNSYATKLIDEDRGIKRIVQYVDDPGNSSALAKVRQMSERSKSRKNSPRNSDEELENTEKNRLLFKEQKFEEEEPVRKKDHFFSRKKVHFGEKNNNNTIDNIKIKRITDIDDDKDKNNTMEPLEQIHTFNEYKPKKIDFIKSTKILTKMMMKTIIEMLLVVIGRKKINGMIINIIILEMRIQMILI